MTEQHDAFLSYTRVDDDFFGGAITSLRKLLELGVKVVSGNTSFNIFQDVDGIEFGQRWQERLDQAISETQFLIPIMTPLFFKSKACRDELEKFIAHEKTVGRGDLILPIYFVTAPVLEKRDQLKEDALASELHARQRYDWREQADLPVNDPKVRAAVRQLAEKIAAAIGRVAPRSDGRNGAGPDGDDGGVPGRGSGGGPGGTSRGGPGGTPMVQRLEAGQQEVAFREASESIKRDEPPKGATAPRRKVLWVDDRPDNNEIERAAMETYHVDFTLALSTGEALAKLRHEKFDAIISDMGRPPDPRAGYTLLEAVRGSGDDTPFFIYAGSRAPEHVREARRRGAQGSTNIGQELISDVFAAIGIRG